MRTVITVDGLAASGKTTLARLFAAQIGFAHLNSGSLYRAIALSAVRENVSPEDGSAIQEVLTRTRIELARADDGTAVVRLNGVVVDSELQSPEISDVTSRIAVHPAIRKALVAMQRNAFPGEHLVAEGRDMGTVIFPDAPLKFFVVADVEVRIARRLRQMEQTGHVHPEDPKVMKKNIQIEILARDERDQARTDSPAKPATDAVVIDNSARSLTSVIESMYSAALARGLVREKQPFEQID